MKKLTFILIGTLMLACSKDSSGPEEATQQIPEFKLTVSAGEGGTVSSSGGTYKKGSKVTITAIPDSEFTFDKWSDGSTSNPITLTINSAQTLTANFIKRKFPLAINLVGEGTVSEEIINTGKNTEYDSGSLVKLTAVPNAEWVFVEWTGSITTAENPIEITIDEAKEITATFEKNKYPLSVNIIGEGTVSEEIIESGKTTNDYTAGSLIRLTAEATEGSLFDGWTGDYEGTDNPLDITMNDSIEVTANFSTIDINYSVEIIGSGSFEVIWEVDLQKLTAEPAEGWRFKSWSGDVESLINLIEIDPTDALQLVLTFVETSNDDLAGYFPNNDYEQLVNALNILQTGWVQEQVDLANAIFSRNLNLGQDIWNAFFEEYLSQNPLSENLFNYLQYPSFYWFDDQMHATLQEGIMKGIFVQLGSKNLSEETDMNIYPYKFLSTIIYSVNPNQTNETSLNDAIFNFYSNYINAYAQLLKLSQTLSGAEERFLPIKFQIAAAFAHYCNLNESSRQQAATILDLAGTAHSIPMQNMWFNHGMLAFVNNFQNFETLELYNSILDVVDGQYHDNIIFTNFDTNVIALDTSMPNYFNTFPLQVGDQIENGFPQEVAPYYADLVYLVFAHELNHGVDFFYVQQWNPQLKDYKDLILVQAGNDRQNYLRSIIGDGFFQNAPQEFFASISNMYFANTELTFEVALERYNNGRTQPMNQFLLMANVYSDNSQVQFFNNDNNAFNVAQKMIQKNASGFIVSLELNGTTYSFNLNPDHTVMSITME
ncbi:MAG: hypothetical protein KJP26_05245 [Maribacter sp.]|nr:hypothetical protein [Maribacter sp.]